MNIKSKIEELRSERGTLTNKVSRIDQEIYQLQRQCTHVPETLEIRESQVLERWLYDMAYSYDSTGQRVIEKRHVTCSVCGKSWTEMRYTDSVWLESGKWEETARREDQGPKAIDPTESARAAGEV